MIVVDVGAVTSVVASNVFVVVVVVVVVVVAAAAAIVVVVRLTRYDVKQTYTKPEELNFKFIQKSSYYAEHSLYIFRVTFVTIHRHVM